jgi:hypothetical protein
MNIQMQMGGLNYIVHQHKEKIWQRAEEKLK